MIDIDNQIHQLKRYMDGLARTTCQVYVNAKQVTEHKEQVTCHSCIEGKNNTVLGWD